MIGDKFDFSRALDGLAKLTLSGGVVGKVTKALIFISFFLTVIALTTSNIYISAVVVGLIFVLTSVSFWRLINFADRHPQAALLEGAEFIRHQKLIHSTKNYSIIPNEVNSQIPSPQQPILMVSQEEALLPDEAQPMDPLQLGDKQ
jgi:hypothetical protein